MKKKYSFMLLMACSLSFAGLGQSVALTNASVTPSPLGTVENNGTGVVEFSLVESSGGTVVAGFDDPNVLIEISLESVSLLNGDVNQITGSVLNYFSLSYNEQDNLIFLEQNSDIEGDFYGTLEIPFTVTSNSNPGNPSNGFNASIEATSENTNADGNIAVFTYTDSNVLSTNTGEALTYRVSPNPTDGQVFIQLGSLRDAQVVVYDLLGKVVLSNNIVNSSSATVNLENLSAAVYFMKISSEGNTKVTRIIKE